MRFLTLESIVFLVKVYALSSTKIYDKARNQIKNLFKVSLLRYIQLLSLCNFAKEVPNNSLSFEGYDIYTGHCSWNISR